MAAASDKQVDEAFLRRAFELSERGTCHRLRVGAVLVSGGHEIAGGFNGGPETGATCLNEGCLVEREGCLRSVHAEARALLAVGPLERRESTLYVTDRPCLECARLLCVSGVREVVYARSYYRHAEIVQMLLAAARIGLRHHPLAGAPESALTAPA